MPDKLCRICDEPTAEFLDLGDQPLSDTLVRPGATAQEFTYRLRVRRCGTCGMVQLADEVPRDRMFTADYPFFTSSSTRMTTHFVDTAASLIDLLTDRDDPFVVEIGANDGTMLTTFADQGIRHLGVDPAGLAGERAGQRGVRMLRAFFEQSTAKAIRDEHGQADVIFAANTLCHIPYLDDVFRGLNELLSDDGLFVFEDPYLGDILRLASFDQIYDEHFFFFSASTVDAMAERFGMKLIDVSRLGVHGGEVRYTLARSGQRSRTAAVEELIGEERRLGLDDPVTYIEFSNRVREIKDKLVTVLEEFAADGTTVAGYAATAKSATLLNYCGIGPDLLPVVYDTTPEKQGLLTPGSHIPVRPFPAPDAVPDVYLLLAWNHAEEIMSKEATFSAGGGRWLLYVPDVSLT